MNQLNRSWNIAASLSLTLSILFWAATPLFLRSFIHEIDSWTANGVRYTFSAFLWSIPILIFYRQGKIDMNILRRAVIPSLINIGGQTLWAKAPYFIEPGMLMFLTRFSTIFSILWSFILFPDELPLFRSKIFGWGLCLSLTGFVGMNVLRGHLSSKVTWIGLLVVLGHGAFMGFYGISIRYMMRGIDPWLSFPVICIYTSTGLLIFMVLFGEPSRLLAMSTGRLEVLALSAIVGIAVAHVFYYYAIEHLGVSISSGCQLIAPFLTALSSYFIFGEKFTVGQWISGILLLSGAGILLSAQQHLGTRTAQVSPTETIIEAEESSPVEEKILISGKVNTP